MNAEQYRELLRLNQERVSDEGGRRDPVEIPVGCSIFPKEIFRASRRWAEKRYKNIVHWNELDKGGHFAAFEQPGAFVDEVRASFRHLRG